MSRQGLKLKAQDAEDIQVVSAILQDAIVPMCDIIYEPENKLMIIGPQRIRREIPVGEIQESGIGERICCAVHIHGVEGAQTHEIDLSNKNLMLDLLALLLDEHELTFIFAGGAKIRLKLGSWWMTIEDFGDSWPIVCNPCHDKKAAS